MILVTGAGGKTGRALLRALAAFDERAIGFMRQPLPGAAACVELAGGRNEPQFVAGDLQDADAVRRAMVGVRAVYHICPNMHPQEAAIGRTVIEAATAAGVERLVYHSVLHPQTEKMPHHWQKLRVEEMLFESGLDFTILQPAVYMHTILAAGDAITQQGVYRVPYAASTRLSFVDLEDVAAVAARVLTESGHSAATYELVGTPPLAQSEIAAILSAALGRPVDVEVVERAAWRRQAQAAGLSGYAIETLLAMFCYYEDFGLSGSTRVLHWLLGREPTGLLTFARRHMVSQ